MHTVQGIKYFKNAVKRLYGNNADNIHFMVCAGGAWTDKDNEAVAWSKKNLKFKNITFCYNEYDIMDLFLMSYCQDNIIANSSFSWWSAWLNENKGKRIIAPANWITTKKEYNLMPPQKDITKKSIYNSYDLVPKNWIRL